MTSRAMARDIHHVELLITDPILIRYLTILAILRNPLSLVLDGFYLS